MASAAEAYKLDSRDSGYGREFGRKRKRGSGGKDVKEEGADKSKEKRKCYNCQLTQHLARSCTKK